MVPGLFKHPIRQAENLMNLLYLSPRELFKRIHVKFPSVGYEILVRVAELAFASNYHRHRQEQY